MTISEPTLVDIHRTMTRIRLFEERVTYEYRRGDIPGFVHTYIGAESVAAGVGAHLGDEDIITSTHRGHGHCIAKGCSFADMMLELYGRETGLCRGRGGSMHIADFRRGMLGANAIVGGGIALAAGGALAAQVKGSQSVAISFFGDGAANQGILHETLNLASIWKLPVVFVCENNGWAESTPAGYAHSIDDIADRAAGYGIPGHVVDGTDAVAVYETAGSAIARARTGHGPSFLEFKTARISGHYLGDPEKYRPKEGRATASARDPLTHLRDRLLHSGAVTADDIERLEEETRREIDDGVESAKAAPLPDPDSVAADVYVSYPLATT